MSVQNKKQSDCPSCLLRASCFDKLSIEQLKEMDEKRVELQFKKGEIICKQGAFATHIMYVQEGLAKIYLETGQKSVITNIVSDGSLIGLPSLVSDNVFHCSAAAIEDSSVCMIDINIFRRFAQTNPRFAWQIITEINENTLQSYDRFVSLTQKQLMGRVADALLFLSEKIYRSHRFKMSLSRRDLSELMGMSIESVTRSIRELKEDNVIEEKDKELSILNREKLKSISQTG